ncbi:MFS transporter [Orrella daihaiensis]|uniref:MFS transporter n=1 Tax=Orrella daihaiensis TaxID=2782176 RepID=A0ABY4AMF9_9BURK|nr:MFS transporter [Orrella daihaiensis]UOD51138.1 MFS transporter [Orrella daihaiensis]
MHIALTGGRVSVMLNAVQLGISKVGVGILIACFAILPMFLAITAGKKIDAHGSFRAMWLASLISTIGAFVPWVWPHWSTLAIAAISIGIGHMGFQIAVQGLLGDSDPVVRLKNYSWFAMAMAVSGFSGPLIAGLSIDYIGHHWAFFMLMLCPAAAFFAVNRLRPILLKSHQPQLKQEQSSGMGDLWKIRSLRYALISNLLLASAWDTHYFVVPLYGVQLGFSATTIGFILAVFSAATFVIRILLPFIQKWVKPWAMIHFAMISAAVYFVIYPWMSQAWVLMMLSFMLGLSLGSTQPSILSLLQQHAPAGRRAEVFGMRMALVNGSQVSMPLAFGALGAISGIMPLFWLTSVALATGAWLTRRSGKDSDK